MLFGSASFIWGCWGSHRYCLRGQKGGFPRYRCLPSQASPDWKKLPRPSAYQEPWPVCSLPLVSGQGRESKTHLRQRRYLAGRMLWQAPAAGAAKCPAISQVHQGKRAHTLAQWLLRGASTDPPCWWHVRLALLLSREGRGPSELPMLLVQGPENARSHWFLCWLGNVICSTLIWFLQFRGPKPNCLFLPTFRALLFSLLHNF